MLVDEQPQELGDEERGPEREADVSRQPPPGSGAEVERGQPLQPAGVGLGPAVHPVELGRQPAVEPQQRVAVDVLVRPAQVGQFHLPAGDRVPHVPERQEPGRRDAVEQLLDGLLQRGPFGE